MWAWRHLPILLISAMLLIAIALELTAVPPLAWAVKMPLVVLLFAYIWRVRNDGARGDGDRRC
ncbi:MAG: hypothetical protein AAFY88_27035 [Acidobacteriota bacterium]